MKRIPLCLLVVLLWLVSSCKKDLSTISLSEWNPEMAAPFVRSQMTLRNLIPADSSLLVEDDSLMVYYYQKDSIIQINADSLITIEDTLSSSYDFSLGDIKMESFGMEAGVTLNDLLPWFDEAVADSLLAHDGEYAVFPPFELLEPVTVEIPPVSQYEVLTFSDGYFDIEITNRLPVALQDVRFDIVDVVNNIVVKSVSLAQIDSGATVHDTLFLKGKTLSNTFSVVINSITSPGSYPDMVLIDLSKGLNVNMIARELRVVSGKAKIENQVIYSTIKMVDMGFDEARIWEILFSGGELKYRLESFLNLTVDILLRLPSADVGGEVPENSFLLPANDFYNSSWSLEEMSIDLTTDSLQPFNMIPVYLQLVIEPTTTLVEFDSSDYVKAVFAMEAMKVAYASGNLGKQTFPIDEDVVDLDLGFLENINGEIIFDDPVLTVNYQNSFGIPIVIHTQFTGVKLSSGNTIDLGVDSIVFDYPQTAGEMAEGSVVFDKTNSNIVDFLDFRPDQLVFSGDAFTNWNNDTMNFFTESSQLLGGTEIRIPLVFSTSSLVFSDTVDFSAGQTSLPVSKGTMLLNVLNGLPFDLNLQLQVPDSVTGVVIDKIDFGNIGSAVVDAQGKVVAPVQSNLKAVFDDDFLNNLERANSLLLSAQTVSAGGGSQPVGLYSDYKLSMAISFEATLKP